MPRSPYFILIFLFAFSFSIKAQSNFNSPYRNAFLQIPQSIAEAQLQFSNQTWYSTPGYAGKREASSILVNYNAVSSGIANHITAHYTHKADSNSLNFGFGVILNTVPDIPYTLELVNDSGKVDYSKISTFTNYHTAIQGHFSQVKTVFGKKIGVGVLGRIIYFKYGSFAQAFGLAIDAGISGRIRKATWQIAIKDITTSPVFWSYTFSKEELEVFEKTGNSAPSNGIDAGAPSIAADFHIPFRIKAWSEIDWNVHLGTVYTLGRSLDALSGVLGSLSPQIALDARIKDKIQFSLASGRFFLLDDGFILNSEGKFEESKTKQLAVSPSAAIQIQLGNSVELGYCLQYQRLSNNTTTLSNIFGLKIKL